MILIFDFIIEEDLPQWQKPALIIKTGEHKHEQQRQELICCLINSLFKTNCKRLEMLTQWNKVDTTMCFNFTFLTKW